MFNAQGSVHSTLVKRAPSPPQSPCLCKSRVFSSAGKRLSVSRTILDNGFFSSGQLRSGQLVFVNPSGCREIRAALNPLSASNTSLVMASSSFPPPDGYRGNVGVCIVNKGDRDFVASRSDTPGAWQMPRGGIDPGEDGEIIARRELKEEIGITSAVFIGQTYGWLCYDFPPDVREKLNKLWGTDWKGQAQRWFPFRFTGDESEVTLDGDESAPPEFIEWKWMDLKDVVEAVSVPV